MNGMSEARNVSPGDADTHIANIDEFYVRRINWLVAIGRTDLIDEIADDCERRRAAPPSAAGEGAAAEVETAGATPAAQRPSRDTRTATPWRDRDRDRTEADAGREAGERGTSAHIADAAVQVAPEVGERLPRPVETGTRIAVARLRRSRRPASRHVPDGQRIRG